MAASRVNNLIDLTNFLKVYCYLQEYIVDSCVLLSHWIIPPTFTAAVLEVTFNKHSRFIFKNSAEDITLIYNIS